MLGTERVVDGALLATALVIDRDGTIAGFQDKVQIDPSEEATYSAGSGRRVFQTGPLTFGVVICHEGWRYPETVRWAARRGAHIVFHPHFHEAEPGGYVPTTFADPANSFHEKAILCRAAENTSYFASVNCASPSSPTTSAVVRPDGTLLCYQPYGKEGLLEYDFMVAAGADPRTIRLGFDGADKLQVNRKGELLITTGKAQLVQHAPYAYQDIKGKQVPVSARYTLHKHIVSLALGDYDHRRPLIAQGGDNKRSTSRKPRFPSALHIRRIAQSAVD